MPSAEQSFRIPLSDIPRDDVPIAEGSNLLAGGLTTTHYQDCSAERNEDESPVCVERFLKRVNPVVLCPSPVWPLKYLTVSLMAVTFWGACFTIFKDSFAPHSNLFQLISLVVAGYIAGMLISLIKLPPLLGMLLVGLGMENVGFLNLSGAYLRAVPILRSIALVVILIKAGMGLDANVLKKLRRIVLQMVFIPCLSEAVTVCVASSYLLSFPWQWGLLLGFVLGAVSPAVVVPSLLSLKERGYGEDKGIATLVIAALSLDDVIAISGFGVVMGSIFSSGDIAERLLHGPLEILIGLTFGITWGLFMWYLPHRDDPGVVFSRSFLLGAGSVFSVLGSQTLGFSGAGPLGCLTAAFVASLGWKMAGWPSNHPVSKVFHLIWELFQPILFCLIGAEMKLSYIQNSDIFTGIAVIVIGLMVRLPNTFLASYGASLNIKERLFLCVCWFPKATVQAAIGPVALDMARQLKADVTVLSYGQTVLTVAVLSILLTAPLGAVAIYLTGPQLLKRVNPFP